METDLRSTSAEQARFVTLMMNDGSVMKVAVDEYGSSPARVRRADGAAQDASLKTLRESIRVMFRAKVDDVALNILVYVINNEPVSVYRVAKTVPYNFSLTYKKANRLLNEGLIRQVPANDPKDHRCKRLIESTVKGLLTSWNLGYLDDHEMLDSLTKKWGVGPDVLSKLDCVFKSLPGAVSDRDTAVFQDLSVLSTAVAVCNGPRPGQGAPHGEEEDKAEKYASRYVLARALGRVSPGCIAVFSTGDYTISYEPEWGRTFVYNCSLCSRSCSMIEVSPRSQKCKALAQVLSSYSVQASPLWAPAEPRTRGRSISQI